MIPCYFQNNFCNWKRKPNGGKSKYAWRRYTKETVVSNELIGPPFDRFNESTNFYIMVSNLVPPDDAEETTADLLSPYLLAKDHKFECFQS